MTVPTNPDGSEDVNDFLLRIRELGERRDKEDEERTKKLEEEILQGRKERQARRAERARSIAGSPTLHASRLSVSSIGQTPSIDPPEQLEPTLQTQDPETPGGTKSSQDLAPLDSGEKRRGSVQDIDMDSPSRASPLSRSRAGTLSWQQRPSSRDFGSRSPGSTSPTRSSHLRNASTASTDNQLSRAHIAQSLSRDPSWFRQTPEPGSSSPVYRKPEERTESVSDLGTTRGLPGISRESTAEPDRKDEVEARSPSPPRTASTLGDSNFSNRYSSVSSVSPATGLGSPVTLSEAPKLDPSQTESLEDSLPPSPTQRRLSPERARSTSPTKGLGGFVQSAMMRRSDSVSKRWSAQLPQGLSRSNSIISNRSSMAGPSLTASVSDMTPVTATRLGRDTSPLPSQRPTSSHSEATVHPPEASERPTTPSGPRNESRLEGSPSRPPLYGHSRSTSSMTADSQIADTPASPFTSRTMDPKRWSPTKASWLESALNRPESPRTQRPPPPQPSWQRDRQSRGSVDMGRFKEVTPVGLMRTPPPGGHFKKPSISGTPSVLGSPSVTRSKESAHEPPVPAKAEAEADAESQLPKADSTEEKPKLEEELEQDEPTKEEPKEDGSKEDDLQEADANTAVFSPMVEPEPEHEPQAAPEEPEATPEPEPTRKAPPPALNPKVNFSRPTREPLSPRQPKSQSNVIDFRANLRKREVAKDAGPEQEPEFKNVFGKLKKTETRNYVAPDELKSNILRGKAALNITGGPKKTQRVDEFKESLVKQKEAMKAGGGSIRRNTAGEKDYPEKPIAAVPEAIAKRQLMNKTNTGNIERADEQVSAVLNDFSPTKTTSPDQPPLPPVPVTEKLVENNEETQNSLPAPNLDITGTTTESIPTSEEESRKLEEQAPPERAVIQAKESASSLRGLPSARRAVAASAPPPSFAAKGKLAGRINPALAGFLSRGPPASTESSKNEPATSVSQDSSSASPSTPLTHMTKGRARGPKRRMPKGPAAVPSAQDTMEVGAVSSPDINPSQAAPEQVIPLESPSESLTKEILVPDAENAQIESPVAKQPTGVMSSLQDALNSGLLQRLRNISPIPAKESIVISPSEKENVNRGFESPVSIRPLSRPPVPPKPNASPSVSSSPSPSPSPMTPTGKSPWSQQRYASPSSPSPLRTSFRENQMEKPATPPPKPVPGVTVATSSPQSKELPSPPIPVKRANVSLAKPPDAHRLSRKMSAPSLVAQAAEARDVIGSFFKAFPNPRDRMDIDPQLMLTGKADAAKIRTMKRQIWELTGDGKRQELPVNQEYVLYEGSMYLCVHIFEAQGSNNAEVYLWCGDDVSEAALDDAMLFTRKVARENSCKLEIVRQGKEPVRFIQALGGIIITRRGSSSRSNSSALYMLCGRKHLGQMAFDEVDYSLRNLCSGFPFVISAPFGKLYLWKGRGSGPEETGAARLISMDLGLTGEFEEVDEGREPETFFEDFAYSRETNPLMTSEYWKLKPKYDHFRTRLLRVDHELAQPPRFWMRRPGSGSPVVRPNDSVQEIEPFCSKDLTEKDVYVLDTFFEIYVIVGDQASQKSADFASAVVFAHEYGILAASLQDRPFIPKSFVALGGIPDRCQSAFRKWDSRSLHAPCVFPLDVAIEALRSQERRD
ncbi:hypothetical protein N7462_005922 [Penicillium macrosclerotiorum]|uniref:uncharacterized protein n=1 Tax=Penicillium macrosclerotiorum TaxID=303699 RepID=UPI0025486DD9|nr:uncharacterized protein N7462_005922 [Penicillium macrosclerotiorum]KAJ5682757.1 hypothetical protein N7462_005922 [Penicillium macrosclerotiorum]